MNINNIMVQTTLFAQAAQRLYKVAYMLPPPDDIPRNRAYTIKLPVQTVISNAMLMCDIIQLTPVSHRTTYMGQLYPQLQYLINTWDRLSKVETLAKLQRRQVEINALRQVALSLHSIFPTVGVPGERVTHPGFSLGMSSDPMVMEKAALLTTQMKRVAKRHAKTLWTISTNYDLTIAENLNRLDPQAAWGEMTDPKTFENEPKMCLIPCHVENLHNPHYSLAGNTRTVGKFTENQKY